MKEALLHILPANRIRTRYIDLVSFASDAGFYYLVPKAVVQPVSEEEIISLFEFSHQYKIPLVFRTGGSFTYSSSTKTCEMALSQAVNANYESILYLVDEAI